MAYRPISLSGYENFNFNSSKQNRSILKIGLNHIRLDLLMEDME